MNHPRKSIFLPQEHLISLNQHFSFKNSSLAQISISALGWKKQCSYWRTPVFLIHHFFMRIQVLGSLSQTYVPYIRILRTGALNFQSGCGKPEKHILIRTPYPFRVQTRSPLPTPCWGVTGSKVRCSIAPFYQTPPPPHTNMSCPPPSLTIFFLNRAFQFYLSYQFLQLFNAFFAILRLTNPPPPLNPVWIRKKERNFQNKKQNMLQG